MDKQNQTGLDSDSAHIYLKQQRFSFLCLNGMRAGNTWKKKSFWGDSHHLLVSGINLFSGAIVQEGAQAETFLEVQRLCVSSPQITADEIIVLIWWFLLFCANCVMAGCDFLPSTKSSLNLFRCRGAKRETTWLSSNQLIHQDQIF